MSKAIWRTTPAAFWDAVQRRLSTIRAVTGALAGTSNICAEANSGTPGTSVFVDITGIVGRRKA
jgi:hypothetical protein